MLYNPDWKKVSLADFIGWLETKSPTEEYNPGDARGYCMIGQYMEARGLGWNDQYFKVCNDLFGKQKMSVIYNLPLTFGGALKRAKAVQKTKETA